MAKTKAFYSGILGAETTVDYGVFAKFKLANTWIVAYQQPEDAKPEESETPDKPGIQLVHNPAPVGHTKGDINTVGAFLNLRVSDIQTFVAEKEAKGASFLTPPIEHYSEIRAYMRDPDNYLIEVGQTKGDPPFSMPANGMLAARFLVLGNRLYPTVRDYYLKLGGKTLLDLPEYNFGMVQLFNLVIGMTTGGSGGGGPMDDKPGVMLQQVHEQQAVFDSFMIIRVKDVKAMYNDLVEKGISFLTPPVELSYEIRCYARDPAGHIIEFGQAK